MASGELPHGELLAAHRRLSVLARASRLFASAPAQLHTLFPVIAEEVARALDGSCAVRIVSADGRFFENLGYFHVDPEANAFVAGLFEQLPQPIDEGASGRSFREHSSILMPDVRTEDMPPSFRTRYGEYVRRWPPTSVMVVPIGRLPHPLGVLFAASHTEGRSYNDDDLLLLQDLADRATLAIENARSFEAAESERKRLLQILEQERLREERQRFLIDASSIASSSLDYEATLASLTELLVPKLADWCALEILEEGENTVPVHVIVAHRDPKKAETLRSMRRRYPPDPRATRGVPNVLRTKKAELYPVLSPAQISQNSGDPGQAKEVSELEITSAMIVPLATRGKVLGAISFFNGGSRQSFNEQDLAFAEELAVRAAISIDNARLYRDAQEAVKRRDDFLSVASHELKTPLTSLQLQLHGMIRNGEREARVTGDVKQVERLVKLDKQVHRLTRLISQLLDASRIASNRFVMQRALVDLGALVHEVAARFEGELAASRCTLTIEVPPRVEGSWDRDRLDQVLTNLIANAVKYAAGTPIEVTVLTTSTWVELRVRDQGMGIRAEDQGRVFGRFERAVSPQNFGGLGLGLWIVQQIVDAHGGTVGVESALGSGATFIVRLPRHPDHRVGRESARPPAP